MTRPGARLHLSQRQSQPPHRVSGGRFIMGETLRRDMEFLFYLLRGLALGFAIADAIYGAIAAFGVSAVTTALVGLRLWIHLIGALFLAWLGLRIMLTRPATPSTTPRDSVPSAARRGGLLAAWASTVALTLTNPATILSFAAVFAGLGLVGVGYIVAGL